MDSGAYFAAYDLSESDINLDEAYALRALLEGAGATVVMTRTGDQGLTEAERAAFCNEPGQQSSSRCTPTASSTPNRTAS